MSNVHVGPENQLKSLFQLLAGISIWSQDSIKQILEEKKQLDVFSKISRKKFGVF